MNIKKLRRLINNYVWALQTNSPNMEHGIKLEKYLDELEFYEYPDSGR
jgi:hypothetical protein